MGYLIVLVALFALMWLLLIRPQRRRQLDQARMQAELEPGVEIVTAGGIHGTLREIEEDVVHVEIAPGTTVRIDRRAVAAVAREAEPVAELEEESGAAGESPAPSGES